MAYASTMNEATGSRLIQLRTPTCGSLRGLLLTAIMTSPYIRSYEPYVSSLIPQQEGALTRIDHEVGQSVSSLPCASVEGSS